MSSEPIVERLREYAHIVQSDRYDDGELLEEAAAEIERLQAGERYVDDLGVDWCVLHNGVRNEDSDRCDAFDWSDEDDMIDENGEYLPCDLRPLVYREVSRDCGIKRNCVKDHSRLCVSWETCGMSEECYYEFQARKAAGKARRG